MVIPILLVSPSPTVRVGLRELLTAEGDIAVVGEAAGAADLVPPWPTQPAVAVLDARAGAAALARLEAGWPALGAVLLGGEFARPRGAVGVAPRGFLTADAGAEELRAAVRAVASGLTVVAPALLRPLLTSPREPAEPEVEEPLTPRELEVVQLLAAGLPNKAIARRLGISEHTAKFHVSAVLAKLGASSRTEAVTTAARRGLVLL